MNFLQSLLLTAPPLLLAVILHEVAHGYTAEKLGDPTARTLGRIKLNPLVHIDPFMTVILPGLLILSGSPIVFGGAKPVPVDPRFFRNPRRGMAYVAMAGPIVNFILAAIFYALMLLLASSSSALMLLPTWASFTLVYWVLHSIIINLVLGLFNLLPVPPLDGGRIAVGFLPLSMARQVAKLERYGLLIVIALLYFGVVDRYLGPVIRFVTKQIEQVLLAG